MPLNQSFVGRVYPASRAYEVGREKIREFAAAIGDANPAYYDREAAQALGYPDVIAPPTFAIVMTLQASRQVIDDPELGIDYSRVVHGEQRFVQSRPIRAGDTLRTTITVESIRSAAGNDIISTRSDLTTSDGEHVVTAYNTLVVRGVSS